MNKATEIKIDATAKTIVELVNACFSDNSARAKVKIVLTRFAEDIEAEAVAGLEAPATPATEPPIPAHD